MQAIFEFHITRRARDRYQFDESLLGTNGRLIVSGPSLPAGAGLAAARRIAERVFEVTQRSIPASDIFAAALIEEILHILVRHYAEHNPGVMTSALDSLRTSLGLRLEETLLRFTYEYPPSSVYQNEQPAEEWLEGSSSSIPHREVALEEMLLVNLANRNPALEPYKEFFDDAVMSGTAYDRALPLLSQYFAHLPPLQSDRPPNETLIDALTAPFKASPYSLEGQLRFLLDRWRTVLDPSLQMLILRAMDFVREEVIRHTGHGDSRGSAPVPHYRGELEYERYSRDLDWMPRLVLIAKNSYVWLEQLSRKYKRWIQTLDQVPDEELDLLAKHGFTGLWLIGLWERSPASRRIKERMGQPEAAASAYAIYSYDIAGEFGGWEALHNLQARAAARGMRLSADMVPNHMGVDSRWVIEHPERFLSVDRPPYPSYSFNSENLCDDARVGIYIEDHYYDHSDAAVVFQRRDHLTGDVRYIYHGNDGTSFPWNDTAQLDYSSGEVREAVIQQILHVARTFPIIRFDAAMTLARKHIQRLWFPEPGSGGAIPSRAEHGMTREEFDRAMPHEFWREVVDRVAAEVPETLLLAEAFWLLEGYFVRTLGMHRVYNSAFMHMLRDEENAKYRELIKNTLEFDPQILKRYVNFMSNPDEKTAVEQFGTGDKYFGVCTLLATMPGLPMFGHGQLDGLREKYGMEFRKPQWEETPDEGMLRGHEWKIFPLLHRRSLFADVEQFYLFDFYGPAGRVNENVIAYSNRRGDERALVICNNKYDSTSGWLRMSAAALDKGAGHLVQRSLGEALGLPHDGYAVYRDYITHLEYIRPCNDLWEKGLHIDLHAYEHHAFLDWRFVAGADWDGVRSAVNDAGVESLEAIRSDLLNQQNALAAVKVLPAARLPAKAAAKKVAAKKSAAKKAVARKVPAKKPAAKKSVAKPKSPAKPSKAAVKKPAAKKPAAGKR